MCAIVGSGIGYVCLRMRGPYLALFTVAFSEVLRIVIVSETEVTGGSGGLRSAPLFHGAPTCRITTSDSRCWSDRWRPCSCW